MSSVRDLLALPEWRESVRVLAGADKLDSAVRAVRPMRAERSIEPGELAVVVEPVSAGDWRIDALLRQVADGSGVGVLLPDTGVLAGTRLLGDRLGVPLLVAEVPSLDLLIAARLLLAAPGLDRANLLMAIHDAVGDQVRPRRTWSPRCARCSPRPSRCSTTSASRSRGTSWRPTRCGWTNRCRSGSPSTAACCSLTRCGCPTPRGRRCGWPPSCAARAPRGPRRCRPRSRWPRARCSGGCWRTACGSSATPGPAPRC
ncbi:hypothetical protein ACFQ0O_22785 [Saccharopolyspora spinosporotrichia]